jgi:hypothetical protein
VPAVHSAVTTGLAPGATALIAVFRADERPLPMFWIACAIGFCAELCFAHDAGGGHLGLSVGWLPADHNWAQRNRLAWNDISEAVFVVSAREPGPEVHEYILRRISGLGRTTRVRRHWLGARVSLVGLGLGVRLVTDHWRRGGDSNPRDQSPSLPHFECGAFNHSATSPSADRESRRACSLAVRGAQGHAPQMTPASNRQVPIGESRICLERREGAGKHDLSPLDHVDAVRNIPRKRRVLLGDQHTHAAPLEL